MEWLTLFLSFFLSVLELESLLLLLLLPLMLWRLGTFSCEFIHFFKGMITLFLVLRLLRRWFFQVIMIGLAFLFEGSAFCLRDSTIFIVHLRFIMIRESWILLKRKWISSFIIWGCVAFILLLIKFRLFESCISLLLVNENRWWFFRICFRWWIINILLDRWWLFEVFWLLLYFVIIIGTFF